MIPIQPQPEPADFWQRVKEPGMNFLKQTPHPKTNEWKNREYWQRILDDLYRAYNGICAYSAEWVPRTTGHPTVDHFIPKSVQPALAYEWHNYRLASLQFNQRKGTHQDILDPFTLKPDWFILDIPSLKVQPHATLSASPREQVLTTTHRLRLNDERCIQSRYRWLRDFCQKHIDFPFLMRNAPFIAYELQRQQMVDDIKSIMGFDQNK